MKDLYGPFPVEDYKSKRSLDVLLHMQIKVGFNNSKLLTTCTPVQSIDAFGIQQLLRLSV